jgi:hypothetical protein
MSTKTIYTAEPQKFSTRIWNELITALTFFVIIVAAIIIGTKNIGIGVCAFFLFSIALLFGYISQYKYRFIQAVSITEEDGEFVFELLYKDELYEHIIRKSNIYTTLDTVAGEKGIVYKLVVFDREKEVFVLYSGFIMSERTLKKIKAELDGE